MSVQITVVIDGLYVILVMVCHAFPVMLAFSSTNKCLLTYLLNSAMVELTNF